ncbi:ciliary microtubule inner protein 2B [Trachinotus anak]|uniref:ciliary microtubule inner protein 2B n=1 Tax=Trachinotus anak TaxID=443729 RepID=UPI0039F1E251
MNRVNMEKYAPKFSKVLLTPDPHYIPGYAGHCPQLKFNVGKSYGKLTAELLTSPDVNHSSHLVVQTGHVPSDDTAALTLRSVPDSNLKKVIPGYTGFIPRSRNYFSCSYSEACRKALTEFHQEGRAKTRRQSTDQPAVVNYTSQQSERPTLPLKAITNEVISYKPLKPFIPTGKPYFMEDDNPQKYFMSGFMGHVPKSRFLIGKGYPMITNQALIQFGKRQSDPTSQDIPGRKDSTTPHMPTIYPSNRGVVPSFTGHIPGYQFMYGHTYGQLSQNALEKSSIKRTLREKS